MFPQLLLLIFASYFKEVLLANSIKSNNNFTLLIYHSNNMHGRFVEYTKGGFARISQVVKQGKKSAKDPVIYLDAGGVFVGTHWFFIHKENITSAFMNALEPDAVTLGFTEFHYGISGLIAYLEKVKFPVVVSNIDFGEQKELKSLIKTTKVLEVKSKKIGIVGYIDPFVAKLYNVESLRIQDPVFALRSFCKDLKTKQKVDVVIALGHATEEIDKKIASNIEEIDVIISGRFYEGLWCDPELDQYSKNYHLELIQNQNSKKHLIANSLPLAQTLGYLKLQFNKDGLTSYEGHSINLNKSIKMDKDIINVLKPFEGEIKKLSSEIIGRSETYLDAESCSKGECNFGNLIADSMVFSYALNYKGLHWSDAPIAFLNSRAIRKSIDPTLTKKAISKMDILSSIPSNQMLYLIELSGKDLVDTLDHCVQNINDLNTFLSLSGLFTLFVGNKTHPLIVRCSLCDIPSFSEFAYDSIYKIITIQYLVIGGDGFLNINNAKSIVPLHDMSLVEAVFKYFEMKQSILAEVDDRITFKNFNFDKSFCLRLKVVFLYLFIPFINVFC